MNSPCSSNKKSRSSYPTLLIIAIEKDFAILIISQLLFFARFTRLLLRIFKRILDKREGLIQRNDLANSPVRIKLVDSLNFWIHFDSPILSGNVHRTLPRRYGKCPNSPLLYWVDFRAQNDLPVVIAPHQIAFGRLVKSPVDWMQLM